jgi:hypothetical protein
MDKPAKYKLAERGGLELDDVVFTFPGENEPVVNDISLREARASGSHSLGQVAEASRLFSRSLPAC